MDPIRTKSVLTLDGFSDKIFICIRPMKTAKRHLDILICVALSVFLCSAIAALGEAKDVELERTINVLSGALQSLTESSKDPCAICARQTKREAFELISSELRAKRVFGSGDLCRFIRTVQLIYKEHGMLCSYRPSSVLIPTDSYI